MKKIPTIFKRNPANRAEVLDEPHPECGWVFAGEGVATRKYDGSSCLIKDGKLYKRREVKGGKTLPTNFVQVDYDEITGKTVGWVPVDMESKDDRWHVEAFSADLPDGTYELLGPKVQGNPENYTQHTLMPHAQADVLDAPRAYAALARWLKGKNIEGLVWHHADGRMAKIKLRDFGLMRAEVTYEDRREDGQA